MNAEKWVDERMQSLDGTGLWQPNAARALAQLKAEEYRKPAGRRKPWMWAVAGISFAAPMLFVMPTPGTCAQSVLGMKCAAPAVAALPAPPLVRNYKESGSPRAPITLEIYSDYECPSCAEFFQQMLPQLMERYVKTRKVKLLHRDFPLPQHTHARLAARYANAAGELGFYDAVVKRLFQTQASWESNGAIDQQVMEVVPPGAMKKLREIVNTDMRLDDTVTTDLAAAAKDGIDRTPTLVFAYGGRRDKVSQVGSFAILQRYLDQLPAN